MKAVVLLMLLAGCGSDNNTTLDGGDDLSAATDGSSGDMKTPADLSCVPGTDGSVSCGAGDMMCGAGSACCVPSSGAPTCEGCCAAGSFAVQCNGPEGCGGNPCCLYLAGGKPSSVACTDTLQQCPGSLSTMGLGGITGQTRRCHIAADCTRNATDTPYPDCCTGTFGGLTQQFCFSKSISSSGVTCP